MEKHKFDPDWMKDPETMKEILRESLAERDEVIESYHDALVKVLKISEGSKNTWLQMVNSIVKETLEMQVEDKPLPKERGRDVMPAKSGTPLSANEWFDHK